MTHLQELKSVHLQLVLSMHRDGLGQEVSKKLLYGRLVGFLTSYQMGNRFQKCSYLTIEFHASKSKRSGACLFYQILKVGAFMFLI